MVRGIRGKIMAEFPFKMERKEIFCTLYQMHALIMYKYMKFVICIAECAHVDFINIMWNSKDLLEET